MSNNFKTGIKPYNPLSDERQMFEIKKMTNPNGGPLQMPKSQPEIPHTPPQKFEKLKKKLSGGK